jgi:hypothetical protein
METDTMKALTSAIALTLALATTATAGGITASTAPAARPYTDAFGCLVKPVFGRDGSVLYTNNVNPGQTACIIPEDGPQFVEVAAAPVVPVTPTDPVAPVEPVEPVEPTDPVEQTDPVEPEVAEPESPASPENGDGK